MKKLIAVALLAVPLTFAQTGTAPTTTDNAGTMKTKKHNKKHSRKAKGDANTGAAAATK